MNKAVWMAKRNYWIAGTGALISLFAFFVLNFLSIGYSFSLPDLGLGGTTTTTPLTSYSIGVTGTSLASYEGLLWVSVLLVVGVLGLSILFLARRSPFGVNVPMNVQARWTALGFVAAAVLSAVCVVASLALIAQTYQSILNEGMGSLGSLGSLNSLGSTFSNLFHFNFTWDIGAYLFLVGLIVIVIAGIMEMSAPARVLSDAEMAVMWNYSQNQYPQNQYNYPTAAYGPPSMQGPQPSADPNAQYGPMGPSQYGGSYPSEGSPYPPVSGQQPPANPYGPPSQYPPYGE